MSVIAAKRVIAGLVLLLSGFHGIGAIAQQRPLDEELKRFLFSERQAYTRLLDAESAAAYADSNIDVTYYKLDLTVTTSPEYLKGVVTVKAFSRTAGLQKVTLDLMQSMQVTGVKAGTKSLAFVQKPSTVDITLDRSYDAGEEFAFDISYEGRPGSSGFGSFAFSDHNGVPWVWTLSEPYGAKDWWPSKDHPTDKADSVDIWITCDAAFRAASNGRLVEVVDNGDGTRTYKWQERYPIATYLVSLAITNYETFSNWFRYSPTDSMEVVNYVLPEQLDKARQSLAAVVGQLQIYSNLFGPYPFLKEKYGHAQFGWGGGMEHQTMTSIGAFGSGLLAHELAHQWFGDKITCANWSSIWLNEGFATYSTGLYYEADRGKDAYRGYMNRLMTDARTAKGSIYVADTTDVHQLFAWPLVYAKGATVLHMLRHVLGDSVFFTAVRAYAADPQLVYGTAVTEDLQRVCEDVSGLDLGYFFSEWIYGQGYPHYSYSWSATPVGSAYEVRIELRQQAGEQPSFFVMPIDFELKSGTWDTTVVLFNDAPLQTYLLQIPQAPDTVLLDPDDWILKDVTLAGQVGTPPAGPPQTFGLEQNYPNPVVSGNTGGPALTTILFNLTQAAPVSLKLYDLLGREVATLAKGSYSAGRHRITFDASRLAAGVYFYRLKVNGESQTRSLVVQQ